MNARVAQLDALTSRWEQLPGEDVAASLALENMLLAQDRLAASEFEYLQAQLTFKLSIFNLKRSMGTLMQNEEVAIGRTTSCGVPEQIVEKPNLDARRMHQGMVEDTVSQPFPVSDQEDYAPVEVSELNFDPAKTSPASPGNQTDEVSMTVSEISDVTRIDPRRSPVVVERLGMLVD